MMSPLSDLPRLRDWRRRRASSWDRSGGNADFWVLGPGETRPLAEVAGPGCIRHIWMTLASREEHYARRSLLRVFWDGEATPSVEVPTGDFFGVGHGIVKEFTSLPLTMSPQDGCAFNSFFPMPFASGARVEMTNEGERHLIVYFYLDYEEHDAPPEALGRFHAHWRRQNPTAGWGDPARRFDQNPEYRGEVWKTPNLDGKDNYVILEARGRGHYVGCNLNIDCFQREKNDWYGEGDDMIFIDGDTWPPTLHGTGTEDYFNTAWSPRTEFSAPYHGITLYSGTPEWPWGGKNSMYRFHIEDPVYFQKSIRVTIEHGHANHLSNDYSSTAYWYQEEPHAPFPAMLPVEKRLPRP
jgi:hypothetical protein